MHCSRRSMRIGAIISFFTLCLVVFRAEDFLSQEAWGKTMFFSAVLAAMAAFPFFAVKWERPVWLRTIVSVPFFLLVPLLMMVVVERLNGNFITGFLTDEDVYENYIVYLLLYMLVYGLSGSMKISVSVVSPILLLFGVANMYVKEFKGSPLVPMDFSSIKTAGNVAAGYTYEVGFEIAMGVAITVFVIALFSRHAMPKKGRGFQWFTRIVTLIVVGGFAGIFYLTDTVADYGLKPDFFNQTRGYTNHGAVLEFTLNTKYLFLAEPSGYDAGDVPEIVSEGAEDAPNILATALIRQGMEPEAANAYVESFTTPGEMGQTPNIIVVMNESFADLSVVGDFETNMPYLSNIDGMRENTIQGNAYVSTIGTGTSNTEFEFLTGNTMAFLPAGSNAYQLYVKEDQPSLVSTLHSLNYFALALHPYFESSWNRPAVYEYLGFEDFISVEDLIDEDILEKYVSSGYSYRVYKRLLRQRYPKKNILLRRYVSDAFNNETIEELYESRDPSKPFFLFNVTMQNHSSYNQEFDNFEQEVFLTSTQGEFPKTDQYLSLIKVTDEEFANLTAYFEQVEEPTVILMFGDHQPFIEDSFYSEVMGQSISKMDDETQQKRYISRFVLWANYDIPNGWIDQISVNYLSTLLMQVTGLPMPEYQSYLASLYEKLPVITAMGCRDAAGNFFQADENNSLEEEIAGYRYVQYNNLADRFHRANSLFYLPETVGAKGNADE